LPGLTKSMAYKSSQMVILHFWNGHQAHMAFQYLVILMVGTEMSFGVKKMTLDALLSRSQLCQMEHHVLSTDRGIN